MQNNKIQDAQNGDKREIDGVMHVYYDDYWIRYYEPPPDSLSEKKRLLDMLKKRTFHHTEIGINTPGERLDEARAAYENEADPLRKRVNAAMLAGALFNRAADIFSIAVDLESRGIRITRDNPLMRECSRCFSEALAFSSQVKHRSGEQGVDELWGETGKVFTMTTVDYYNSRYRKIAQAMRDIDRIGDAMRDTFCAHTWFAKLSPLLDGLTESAKRECEIFKSDPDNFWVWPKFVADCERIKQFRADMPKGAPTELERHLKRGVLLIRRGQDLVSWVANLRVPMPEAMRAYLDRCEKYRGQTAAFTRDE